MWREWRRRRQRRGAFEREPGGDYGWGDGFGVEWLDGVEREWWGQQRQWWEYDWWVRWW